MYLTWKPFQQLDTRFEILTETLNWFECDIDSHVPWCLDLSLAERNGPGIHDSPEGISRDTANQRSVGKFLSFYQSIYFPSSIAVPSWQSSFTLVWSKRLFHRVCSECSYYIHIELWRKKCSKLCWSDTNCFYFTTLSKWHMSQLSILTSWIFYKVTALFII